MSAQRDLVLLYDGLCGFCNGTVRFILAQDRRGTMRFAPLQGEYARKVLAQHPEVAGADSLVLVEEQGEVTRVTLRSDAVFEIAGYVGGIWRLAGALRVVPRMLRNWSYDLFARYRYHLFGHFDSCPVPAPGVRERFLA